MSGLALVLSRDGGPVSPEELAGVFAALDHRGPDGGREIARPGARLGHRHFWTTPEEVGEEQPVEDQSSDLTVLLDGRLDNREELLAALGVRRPEISDARLLLRAWREWGGGCLARLLGPFAFIVREGRSGRVICARDPLGDRTLFWARAGGRIVVASEESAILRHPAVSPSLDEVSLARFFAIDAPRPGATFFAGVRELPPGHVLVLDEGSVALERYWRPPIGRVLRLARDADYVERFRELLTESVRCRLRTVGEPVVLMSGGLDSTSVAALAHRERPSGAEPLRTISWVFDELQEADESRFIAVMVEHFGFRAELLPADGGWPLRDPDFWRAARNAPLEGPFRTLAEGAYQKVSEAGSRVLLTGEYGDHLFAGGASWLRDLLEEDRLGEAARGLGGSLRRGAAGPPLRTVLARALGVPPRRPQPRPWLTRRARRLLGEEPGGVTVDGRRPEQAALLLGARAARGASGEQANAARAGIELRQPYRDRRLVEFVLGVPAHLLFRPGRTKWMLREAMCGTLPPPVRLRTLRSSLNALFCRGLADRELETVTSLLWDSPRVWPDFVRPDWLRAAFPRMLRERDEGPSGLVSWYCLVAELWMQGLAASGLEPQVGSQRSSRDG